MSAVFVRALERRFGATRVLAGLDLQVEPGEHVTITGANGSGKTTLLRILAGLLRPSSGDVEVLDGSTEETSVRKHIGVVGHSPSMYPRMTALENIRFWAGLYADRSAPDRGAELLAALGLDPADRRPVGTYSQGMRQRAAVARALAHAPSLVLADEPCAGLDAAGAETVASLLRTVETVVVATHERDGNQLQDAVGRRLVLRNGKLVAA
jgi:heme ABC exporter ATP-binding subunit CcmA